MKGTSVSADPQLSSVPNYYYGYNPESSIVYVDYQPSQQTPLYYNQYYPNYRDYAYNYNYNNRDLLNYNRNWYGYGYNYNPTRYGWDYTLFYIYILVVSPRIAKYAEIWT